MLRVLSRFMANTVKDFWESISKVHTFDNHGYYRINEITKIPSKPGIYGWFISVNQHNFDDYFKVFKQKRIKINIKGNLNEEYDGNVKNIFSSKNFASPTIDHALCELSSYIFCPPIYIGISKDLNKRLTEHTGELNKIITGKIKPSSPLKLGQTDFDTMYESKHFAQRVGFVLHSLNIFNINPIFIKTIELPLTYSWIQLQKVEKYLNRTYLPIYGRK